MPSVAHVIADAAHDADPFRSLIRDGLRAEAQFPSNPSRARPCPLDAQLYAESRLIETFFNRLKRFRRIALRCEKTLPAFMGFVHLACAMDWLRGMQTPPRSPRRSFTGTPRRDRSPGLGFDGVEAA